MTLSVSDFPFVTCTTAASVLTCALEFPLTVDSVSGLFPVTLALTPAAAVGDTGAVTVTMTADGVSPVSGTSKITVGEGVDLAAGPGVERTAAPGATVDFPMSLTNAGTTAVHGVALVFFEDYPLVPTTRHSNCLYLDDSPLACLFDTDLAPGGGYALSTPFRMRIRPDTQAPKEVALETLWLTAADWADFRSLLTRVGVPAGTSGTGPALDLVSAVSAAAAPPQTDPNPENSSSFSSVSVTGNNQTDLAAVGATATGAAGADVTVQVGLTNKGPVTLDSGRSGEPLTTVFVSIPPGTSATAVPRTCFPTGVTEPQPGEPGHRAYACHSGTFLKPGDSSLLDFTLHLDRAVTNATGIIRLNRDPEGEPAYEQDINPANDTAKLVINPPGGGSGGSLPITGVRAGAIALAGVVACLLGVAGYLVARRRRVRFIAA